MDKDIKVTMVTRESSIDSLIKECAVGYLPFSGPNSLCSKVAAMGYNTASLYEMLRAYKITHGIK